MLPGSGGSQPDNCGGTETRSILLHEELTRQIIGAAIDVHKALGPGLLDRLTRNVSVMNYIFGISPFSAKYLFLLNRRM